MRLKRFLSSLAVTTLLATGLALVQASPASAVSCGIGIGLTEKQGNLIWGHGSLYGSCTPGYDDAVISIYRYNGWPSSWSQVKSYGFDAVGVEQWIYFDCGGWGTQTWRTQIDRWEGDFLVDSKYSNQIRVTCS